MSQSKNRQHQFIIPNIPWLVLSLLLIYGLTSWPWWQPGYFVTLDWVVGPDSTLVWPAVVQHVWLALVLVGGVVSMLAMLRAWQPRLVSLAWWLGGVLWVYNPWVYQRLLAGHMRLLLGHAVLPLVLLLLLVAARRRDARWLAAAVLAFALMVGLSLHHAVMGGVFVLAWIIAQLWRKDRPGWRFWWPLLGVGLLLPLGLWRGGDILPGITLDHFYAYVGAPHPELGVVPNFLMLHGFWREGTEMLLARDYLLWWTAVVLLLSVMAIGLISGFRRRGLPWWLLSAGVVSFVLSLGVAAPTWRLTTWLAEHVPFYVGMREAQKFLSGWLLVYVVLAALGVDWLWRRSQRRVWQLGVGLLILILLLGLGGRMLFGLSGQLRPVAYPESWALAKQQIEQDPGALTELPFTLYHRYPFAERESATALDAYFDTTVVRSYNAWMGTEDHRALITHQQGLEDCFLENDWACFAAEARLQGVRYVLYQFERAQNIDFAQVEADAASAIVVRDAQAALIDLNPSP